MSRRYKALAVGAAFLGIPLFAQTPSAQDLLKSMQSRGAVVQMPVASPSQAAPHIAMPKPPTSRSAGDISEEIKLGQDVARKILGAAPLVENAELQLYVALVGSAVASQGERPNLPWMFGVVDTPTINAFALPGGIILISRGLFETLATEDELAAVLAHEIAHVQRQHHYRVVKRQQSIADVSDMVRQNNVPAGDLLAAAMQKTTLIIARGLDKGAEYEADRDGMVLSMRAGYDSSALISVLEKLDYAAAQDGSSLLFQTHPSPAGRISALSLYDDPRLVDASQLSQSANRIKAYQSGKKP